MCAIVVQKIELYFLAISEYKSPTIVATIMNVTVEPGVELGKTV